MNHFLAVVAQLARSVAGMRSATGRAVVQKSRKFYDPARPTPRCSVCGQPVTASLRSPPDFCHLLARAVA